MLKSLLVPVICLMAMQSCAQKDNTAKTKKETKTMTANNTNLDTATFGTGCFWCTEAVFQQLNGVEKVTSGYSGGHTAKPTYKEVCSGLTGHAEVIQLVYDPSKISFKELLEVFWQTHDPTTLNRQGNDSGTQYRSVIFLGYCLNCTPCWIQQFDSIGTIVAVIHIYIYIYIHSV